jgi:hypothetical protein
VTLCDIDARQELWVWRSLLQNQTVTRNLHPARKDSKVFNTVRLADWNASYGHRYKEHLLSKSGRSANGEAIWGGSGVNDREHVTPSSRRIYLFAVAVIWYPVYTNKILRQAAPAREVADARRPLVRPPSVYLFLT